MESSKQSTHIIMSILGKNGETTVDETVDELTSIRSAQNCQNVNISKFKVQSVLERGVRYGFIRKNGQKYFLYDLHQTDTGKRKRKQGKSTRRANKKKKNAKATRKQERKHRTFLDEIAAKRANDNKMRRKDRKMQSNATVMRKVKKRELRSYQPRRIGFTEENVDEMSE